MNKPTLILIEDLGYITKTKQSKITKHYGKYKCSCGAIEIFTIHSVKTGRNNNCMNCRKKRYHGHSKTRLHKIWIKMKERCNYKDDIGYKYYGGKGIKVCKSWDENFINFYNWAIDNGYKENLTIDRIKVHENYEPLNCRWATTHQQSVNRDLQKINKWGYRGVSKKRGRNKFLARITINKKTIQLGYFDTAEIAGFEYNNYIIRNKLDYPLNTIRN